VIVLKGSAERRITPVPLGGGAVVSVKVLDSVEEGRARASAQRLLRMLRDGREALDIIGVPLPQMVAAGSDEGLERYVVSVEVASAAVVDWTGIGDEAGTPVEPSRTAIALLLLDVRARERIHAAALSDLHERRAEGNG
jgi:hypothetical protein